MTITVTITTTKSAGLQFYRDLSPDATSKVQSIDDWTATQPGFISESHSRPNENTAIQTLVWDTVDHYVAFMAARQQLPEQQSRATYNIAHGINSTIYESLS